MRFPTSSSAFVAVAAAVTVLLGGCASTTVPDITLTGSPLDPPPPHRIEPVDFDEFSGVVAGLSGRVVVVNVWASWCAPCRAEAPTIRRLADAIAPRAQMLGLVAEDSATKAEEFVAEFSWEFPNMIDSTGSISQRLQMRGFPTTYVFDPAGKLSAVLFGGMTEQRLAAAIAEALP